MLRDLCWLLRDLRDSLLRLDVTLFGKLEQQLSQLEFLVAKEEFFLEDFKLMSEPHEVINVDLGQLPHALDFQQNGVQQVLLAF